MRFWFSVIMCVLLIFTAVKSFFDARLDGVLICGVLAAMNAAFAYADFTRGGDQS